MRRREFIVLLGGAATWPLAALAQQQAAPLIGFLSSRSPEESAGHTAAFLEGLKAFGYIDGRTATIEYRWAKGAEPPPWSSRTIRSSIRAGINSWRSRRNGGFPRSTTSGSFRLAAA